MMRVLHAHSGNLFGGIETALLALAGTGEHPLAHAFALAFDDRFADRLRAAGHPVHRLAPVRLSRPWSTWRARRGLRRLLAAVKPDVVLVHSVWSLVVYGPVVRRARIPLAAWLHTPPTGDLPLDRLARRIRPDLVIANSRYTAAHVPRLWPDATPPVVHPPVVRPEDDPPGARRRGSSGPVRIIQVARLERGKGQHILLEALHALPGDWECRFVGGAGLSAERYRAELLEHTRRRQLEGRVEFLGARDDAPALIAAADILAHPNIEPESFGIVFVEAMYAGVPVVASASGGAPEVVTGDTGVLILPGDIAELHAVLARLVTDRALRDQLGRAGPARAQALTDPPARAAELADALGVIVH